MDYLSWSDDGKLYDEHYGFSITFPESWSFQNNATLNEIRSSQLEETQDRGGHVTNNQGLENIAVLYAPDGESAVISYRNYRGSIQEELAQGIESFKPILFDGWDEEKSTIYDVETISLKDTAIELLKFHLVSKDDKTQCLQYNYFIPLTDDIYVVISYASFDMSSENDYSLRRAIETFEKVIPTRDR